MNSDHSAAADVMYAAAQAGRLDPGRAEVFDRYDGASVVDGEAIQLAVLDRHRQAGQRVGGWKVGLTSRDGRDSMGAGVRPFGFVLAGRVLASGAEVSLSAMGTPSVEPEICLTIGERLSGTDVTVEQARAAVVSVAASFEVLEKRVPGELRRPVIRVADALGQWGIVVGPEHPAGVALDSLTVGLLRDGEPVGTATSTPDILDDPYLSLTRACRELARFGLALEPGQRVITGSLLPPAVVSGPGEWRASFGPIGEVAVRFV
ncbi:fumarylacetoacetate hydrolase family protein [Rugosimonospora acidiphila]|uniref:Fumarylacetoacetate hydrolase family protein n=1 Tax=Rugosimonospora acidiphila TaxID=556531 RepID=A0ABP9SI00_9ACTN